MFEIIKNFKHIKNLFQLIHFPFLKYTYNEKLFSFLENKIGIWLKIGSNIRYSVKSLWVTLLLCTYIAKIMGLKKKMYVRNSRLLLCTELNFSIIDLSWADTCQSYVTRAKQIPLPSNRHRAETEKVALFNSFTTFWHYLSICIDFKGEFRIRWLSIMFKTYFLF